MGNYEKAEGFKITNWDESLKKLKDQFSQLKGAELKFETGQENDLLNRIEKRINKRGSEVIDIINSYQKKSRF